jgi:hypothetical protein
MNSSSKSKTDSNKDSKNSNKDSKNSNKDSIKKSIFSKFLSKNQNIEPTEIQTFNYVSNYAPPNFPSFIQPLNIPNQNSNNNIPLLNLRRKSIRRTSFSNTILEPLKISNCDIESTTDSTVDSVMDDLKLEIPTITNITGVGPLFSSKNPAYIVARLMYKFVLKNTQRIFFQNNDDMNLFLTNNFIA